MDGGGRDGSRGARGTWKCEGNKRKGERREKMRDGEKLNFGKK